MIAPWLTFRVVRASHWSEHIPSFTFELASVVAKVGCLPSSTRAAAMRLTHGGMVRSCGLGRDGGRQSKLMLLFTPASRRPPSSANFSSGVPMASPSTRATSCSSGTLSALLQWDPIIKYYYNIIVKWY
jgi:hypothetical protein